MVGAVTLSRLIKEEDLSRGVLDQPPVKSGALHMVKMSPEGYSRFDDLICGSEPKFELLPECAGNSSPFEPWGKLHVLRTDAGRIIVQKAQHRA